MRIEIVLPTDRTRPGTLSVFESGATPTLGPFPCLGKADNAKAASVGNRTRSPLRRYGDTPTGEWQVIQHIPPASEVSDVRTYGPHGALDLWPTSGQAVAAYANGRRGIWIHGGAPSASGGLRPTHGCIRVANATIRDLVARALESLHRGIQPTLSIVERDSVAPIAAVGMLALAPDAMLGLARDAMLALAPDATARDFATGDEAMRHAITRDTPVQVLRYGAGYRVAPWDAPVPVASPVADLVADADAFCVVFAGGRVYARASAQAPRRWVDVPDARAYLALPETRQRRHRRALVEKLQTHLQHKPDDLAPLAAVELAVLVAREAPRVYPVLPIDQTGKKFRGGQTRGATTPIALWPLQEPRCYLPVIAEVEGRLESVNAYDLGAGVSLGPIQINVQRGALLHFLQMLQDGDPALWGELFAPLGWSVERHANTLVLRTPAGPLTTEAAQIAYLQSGNPATPAFDAIDAAFRRRLAGVFAQAVAWPHVQEMVCAATGKWLEPGLRKLDTGGIERLDPLAPKRDCFVLRAMLLSSYVRYSGYLGRIVAALAGHTGATAQLAHWEAAVHTGVGNERHRLNLLNRLDEQRRHATEVYTHLLAAH